MTYDAIIVGASFAGLVVAHRLRGRVLLIDRQPIGAGQTSACGTPFGVLRALEAEDLAFQTHERMVVHFSDRNVDYRLPYPFCTFDYTALCKRLFMRSGAHFAQALVSGYDRGQVVTDAGRFHAPVIVDASGWRAVLARTVDPRYVNRRCLSFGLETVVPYREDGLHFWLDPAVLSAGIGWVFPGGAMAHVGLGSYVGRTDLKQQLSSFLGRFGLSFGDRMQGGYLPWGLREPVMDRLFVVGDAAGQCLGFSGEGIRPAMYFSAACGSLVQRAIDGTCTLGVALDTYRAFVRRHSWMFQLMANAQRAAVRIPPRLLGPLGSWASPDVVVAALMGRYRSWALPDRIGVADA